MRKREIHTNMAGTTAKRAPRNRTLTLSAERLAQLRKKLECPETNLSAETMRDRIFCGDFFRLIHLFPAHCADLMVIDPPYNLSKNFHGLNFSRKKDAGYLEYLESWFPRLLRLLKPGGSVYLCGDWQCSAAEYQVLSRHLTVRNRIVWQREKGRGAAKNWKNGCEDIWFATAGNQYYFDADAVKLRRKVLAPYRGRDGQPKDWEATENGKFRMTSPSNFWDDVTVPYWSMPENTDHPTQKPEKLIAKLILASSRPGDLVFDPFMGSGTTAVTARKLGRHFAGIELNPEYCCWALERLERAEKNPAIQGYSDGVFWERNTEKEQSNAGRKKRTES